MIEHRLAASDGWHTDVFRGLILGLKHLSDLLDIWSVERSRVEGEPKGGRNT